jgi:glutamate-1-semialdehyde 2,1-aminomutase
MGLIPADEEFLKNLRKLCDEHNTLLIFDEVMSGFRAGLNGALTHTSVTPDIVTLGKVIGGGMPVGAFGAKSDIMDKLSPDGPVYQAGTLSGNPVAMAAGLATLKQIKQKDFYSSLELKAKKLTDGLQRVAKENNIPLQVTVRGSMFGFFFSNTPVKNFQQATECDIEKFGKFHQGMIEEGVYLACSAYETGFICVSMSDEDIDNTIEKAKKVFMNI